MRKVQTKQQLKQVQGGVNKKIMQRFQRTYTPISCYHNVCEHRFCSCASVDYTD